MAGTGNYYTRQKIQPGNRLVKCALSLIKIMVHKQYQQALLQGPFSLR